MIEIRNLTKAFGSTTALEDVSLSADGGILGVCGLAGAGKSTLLGLVSGLYLASSGNVIINGTPIMPQIDIAKKRVGSLLQEAPLFDEMTAQEYLLFIGETKKIDYEKLYRQIDEVLDLFDLSEEKEHPISSLSKGKKKALAIAQTLLGNPEIVVLDEPFLGLSAREASAMKQIIKMLGEIKTVVIASRFPSAISEICDSIAILSDGQLVAHDTPDALLASLDGIVAYEVNAKLDTEQLVEKLSSIDGVNECIALRSKSAGTSRIKVICASEIDLVSSLSGDGVDGEIEVSTASLSLDDLCVSLAAAKEDN